MWAWVLQGVVGWVHMDYRLLIVMELHAPGYYRLPGSASPGVNLTR